MTTFAPSADRSLAPRRALLHPLFLTSLVVLALNDHALKGAGILPEFATGKLSDFAGMLVAPLVLAAIVGVRTRRAWRMVHVPVGLVFAAIQLSPWAAAAWAGGLARIGLSWVTTPDVTDLVALPLLALSAILYPRAMWGGTGHSLRRSLELGVAGAGLLVCTATSAVDNSIDTPDLWTTVWVHNGTDASVIVRVRPLRPSVDLDCDAIQADPGGLVSAPLFGNAQSWTLPAGENLAVAETVAGTGQIWGGEPEVSAPDRECLVGLVEVDGVAPAVFFWRPETFERRSIPSEGWDADIPGGVRVSVSEDGQARFTDDAHNIAFTVATALPPTGGACAPQNEGDRVAWGEVPVGLHRLAAVDPGVDGCLRLDLVPPGAELELGPRSQWYLCVPAEVFPFEAGQEISIEALDTGASVGVRVAAQITGLAELWVYAGALAPATKGVTFAPVPDYGCDLRAEPSCGTISRSSVILAGGDQFEGAEVSAGQAPTTLQADDGSRAIVYVAHAQERVAVDAECARGPDTIGDDVELAVAIIPAAE